MIGVSTSRLKLEAFVPNGKAGETEYDSRQ